MSPALLLLALSNMIFFALHIGSVGSFPKPLSKEEEMDCFIKIKEGDSSAKAKLIEHNLRLVAHIIKKYYSSYQDQEDLISIGTIGLIKAVSSFDYSKGTKFATYASRCIENEILMHFRSKKKSAHDIYLSDSIDMDKDGNSITWGDILPDDVNILDDIDLHLQSDQLYKLLLKLPKREQEIITLRYGLYGTLPMTQREVAEKTGISRSYVSRIEKKALLTLREGFK